MITSQGCDMITDYLFKPIQNVSACLRNVYIGRSLRGTQRQLSEIICSEDDLRSRIFGTFVVKFPAYLPLLGFFNF